MLSIEEIKKACEFAEGFEWLDCELLESPDKLGWCKSSMKDTRFRSVYYKLLLQKTIEGLNKNTEINIEAYTYFFRVYNNDLCVEIFSHDEMPIDMAKEIMIKYILGKIK